MGRRLGLLVLVGCSMLLSGAAMGAPTSTHVHFTANGDIAQSAATSGAVLDAIDDADPDLHLALGDLSYGTVGAEQSWCDFVTSRVGASACSMGNFRRSRRRR